MAKDNTVVISDLHMDSWGERLFHGKTKLTHFLDFIDYIEPTTARLIINGDMIDAPPKDANILPDFIKVLSRLYDLSNTTEIYYIVGNHDINLWGLRVHNFHNINVIYPTGKKLHIDFGEGADKKYIYLEHGHYFDPAIALYTYNVLKEITPKISIINGLKMMYYRITGQGHTKQIEKLILDRSSAIGRVHHDLFRAVQKRDIDTGEKIASNGTGSVDDILKSLEVSGWKLGDKVVKKIFNPLVFTEAAEDIFSNFCITDPDKTINAVIFGHTHQPLERTITYKDRSTLYLNSGDWNEPVLEKDPDSHNSSFILFNKDGAVVRNANGHAVRDYIVDTYGPIE